MAAAVGHIEVVEKLVEAGCAWPHGKKANTGLGAPVDVVQLLSQKTGIPVRVSAGAMLSLRQLRSCRHHPTGTSCWQWLSVVQKAGTTKQRHRWSAELWLMV
jgi:hypothetical protein